ncbi:MAG: maleylpyruvate isomerase N-terminal domain-containing protein, partial [Mycobacteriales bacterium]
MAIPTREIAGCRAAHASLLATIGDLTDADIRRPSLLPSWTIGHVLTHLARNSDSCVRRLAGAREDVVIDQYRGGAAGRAAEIESGASRPAAEIVADVRASAAAVEEIATALPAEAWSRMTRGV